MDSAILLGFIEEAENYLPIIRGGVLLCSQETKPKEELEISIKHLHTLKGAAAMIGLKDISEYAEELEQDLKSLSAAKILLSDEKINKILDKIIKLEAQISDLRFGMDDFEMDADSFVEESFESLQKDEVNAEKSVKLEDELKEDSFEDFEIDDEMLEIFAMEAEDHLRNINENLELLEKDANNREALLEIRRSSHTLKGSAGIVGLKTLSKLAHKVEDLLDYISDNDIESNEEIFNLLLTATDCISAVTNNETSDELTDNISKTQDKFDTLLKELQNSESKEESVVKEKVQQGENQPKDKEKTDPKIETETKEAEIVSEIVPSIHSTSPPSVSRSVIRVSLDRLDDLVKLVGEMVFSRSVFEQRLYELEQQINELQNSTRRMRHSTGKLETSFDLGIPNNLALDSKNYNPLASFQKQSSTEFDSLEFDRYTEFNQTTRELIETTNDALSINTELDTVHNFLEMLFDSQKHLIDEMQEKLLSLRMVSFGTLTSRLQRTVRITAEEEEKFVNLTIEGEHLEVDTQILDALIEPLLHLLRNAVAHGIEPPETRRLLGKDERGNITLKVYSEGTHIVLSISDDGCGISSNAIKEKAVAAKLISKKESLSLDEDEALELVFMPGLTTADEISQIAGRGVGMNIVKTNVERQNGTILINSKKQKGTTFTLRLPMALAVTRSLLVQANNQIYAFPLKLVKHISEISPKELEKANKKKELNLGSKNYTLSHLNELLSLPVSPNHITQDIPVLLLETANNPCALIVDKIIKPQEIVIKPLEKPLKDVRSFLGASLLGDGSVVPVLDLVYLLNEHKTKRKEKKSKPNIATKEKIKVMIVDDSPSVRHVNSTLVKNNNWEPIVAKDGLEALEILNSLTTLPDIILTDVEMPEMDGYELLASLKMLEKIKPIPVIMITSRAGEKHRRKAFDLGVSEYLSKPYDESKLIETIENLCS